MYAVSEEVFCGMMTADDQRGKEKSKAGYAVKLIVFFNKLNLPILSSIIIKVKILGKAFSIELLKKDFSQA